MGNSSLVNYTCISPNRTSPRNHTIDKITIHHMAGNLSVESCGNVFKPTSRKASSNYGVGTDGRIGLYVEEKDRSWCSSNADNDHRAITIEVANDGGADTNWHVSDTAIQSLIRLCIDICQRNNIDKLVFTGNKDGNLTLHKYFARTACPGPYLESKIPFIVNEVNKVLCNRPILGITPVVKPTYSKELFIEEIAKAVRKIAPQFGIKVYSPIIAQACLETGYGTSELAINACNFFGLKWRKNRVPSAIGIYNKVGSEQNADGSYTFSAMQWCKFNSLEDSVRGYFEFISISRYNNLKGVIDPLKYLQLIKADGYATSLDYVDKVYSILINNNLQRFDNGVDSDKDFVNQLLFKCPFLVKVNTPKLNIRTGAGTNFNKIGRYTGIGVFTIIEVKQGAGSKKGWGKLKSGLGWISLDYCEVK